MNELKIIKVLMTTLGLGRQGSPDSGAAEGAPAPGLCPGPGPGAGEPLQPAADPRHGQGEPPGEAVVRARHCVGARPPSSGSHQ